MIDTGHWTGPEHAAFLRQHAIPHVHQARWLQIVPHLNPLTHVLNALRTLILDSARLGHIVKRAQRVYGYECFDRISGPKRCTVSSRIICEQGAGWLGRVGPHIGFSVFNLCYRVLQNIKEFYGQKLGAIDGEIGHVKDFYFDDKSWAVRYLVVDTGTWLSGRLVLLTTHAFAANAFGTFDPASGALKVNLTRQQIENSPSIETHRPVSRQDEIDYYSYYGWPSYWHDYGIGALAGIPPVKIPSPPERHAHHGHNQRDDVHLRSVKDVTGYSVHATDGAIGTVSSFMVHGTDWAVREMVIETGHWYAGKPVLVSTKHVTLISHDESTVSLNLSKHDILGTQREGVEETAATNK